MPKQPETPVDDARSDAARESSANPSSADRDAPGPGDGTIFSEEIRPKEHGGRDGPDPVRYGDWEKNGRCIDF
ncbi:DUF1674 domain-containing protein [Salinisphaera sp.]|uniref:DUF1674 domain-containing protein n=1 Tax=Salinisphaera sp. TaxID=1914330 RepID=UPI002D7815FD|nr:DUF1674 domain-containing protein [Salinisphaera sp.]HET7313731.1 DUF1674 domain-containing protein [Salinisphaera sp.]